MCVIVKKTVRRREPTRERERKKKRKTRKKAMKKNIGSSLLKLNLFISILGSSQTTSARLEPQAIKNTCLCVQVQLPFQKRKPTCRVLASLHPPPRTPTSAWFSVSSIFVRFLVVFKKAGIEFLSDLREASQQDLLELGVKKFHLKRLLKAATAAAPSPRPHPPSSPPNTE